MIFSSTKRQKEVKTISACTESTYLLFYALKKIFISWHNPFKQRGFDIGRVQSCVLRLPKYWPPGPTPPHTRRAERGWGGGVSIFWKTQDIGLVSYSNNLSTLLSIRLLGNLSELRAAAARPPGRQRGQDRRGPGGRWGRTQWRGRRFYRYHRQYTVIWSTIELLFLAITISVSSKICYNYLVFRSGT